MRSWAALSFLRPASARSRPGRPVKLRNSFPKHLEKNAREGKALLGSARPAGLTDTRARKRDGATPPVVLVIDDEEHIREVVQVALEEAGGWTVVAAASGEEGLARAARDQPDVILLDVMMPGLDGITAFEALRTNSSTRHIPVILLTAKIQSTDRRRFTELGVDGVIAKPFDPLALPSHVREMLGWEE